MSSGPLYRDPWARREAWRKTPEYFSKRVMFRNVFPGFGIALVAFTGYVIVDELMLKGKKDQHGHGGGEHH
jgi:NADH dehydrogenase (ubiquinone) 1 beta subcomplex subunit 3